MTPPPQQPRGTPQRKARRMRPQMKRLRSTEGGRLDTRGRSLHIGEQTSSGRWLTRTSTSSLGRCSGREETCLLRPRLRRRKAPARIRSNNPEATRRLQAARTEREKRWQNQSESLPAMQQATSVSVPTATTRIGRKGVRVGGRSVGLASRCTWMTSRPPTVAGSAPEEQRS